MSSTLTRLARILARNRDLAAVNDMSIAVLQDFVPTLVNESTPKDNAPEEPLLLHHVPEVIRYRLAAGSEHDALRPESIGSVTSAGHVFLSNRSAISPQNFTERILLHGNQPGVPDNAKDAAPHNPRWARCIVTILTDSSPEEDKHTDAGVILFDESRTGTRAIRMIAEIVDSAQLFPFTTVAAPLAPMSAPNIIEDDDDDVAQISDPSTQDQVQMMQLLWQQHVSRVWDRELQFLEDAVELLGDIAAWEPSVLRIPIYRLVVGVTDTASTRLDSFYALTNAVIHHCVDSEYSILLDSTLVLRGIHALSMLPSEASEERDRLQAALRLFAVRCLEERRALPMPSPCACRDMPIARGPSQDEVVALLRKHSTDELRPPSVLLHCQQGISRSASAVLLYFMWRLQPLILHAAPRDESDESAPTFMTLVSAVQRVRPLVQPNLCFMAEMRSLWKRWLVPVPPAGG